MNIDLPELQLYPLSINYLVMLVCLKKRDIESIRETLAMKSQEISTALLSGQAYLIYSVNEKRFYIVLIGLATNSL